MFLTPDFNRGKNTTIDYNPKRKERFF